MIFKLVLVEAFYFSAWLLEANGTETVYTSFLLLVLINIQFQHINKIVMTRISFIYKKTNKHSTGSTNLSDKQKTQRFRLKATQ